jgi:hypothetical protein
MRYIKSDMKNWNEFLFQLFINLIVPLLGPSGAIGLLVVFKEQLPLILYNILIWLFWLLIVVVIIRFIFYEAFNKAVKYVKQRLNSRNRTKLLLEWYNNFVRLSDIVWDIATTSGEWTTPSDEQIKKYTHLQVWFRDNRARFIPIWYRFRNNRPPSGYHPDSSSLEHEIINQKEDAFSCFYEPLTLDRLGPMMQHEFHTNDGDRVRYVLTKLRVLLAELIEWDKTR